MTIFIKFMVMVTLGILNIAGHAIASELRMAVTTSFNNSGLSEVLLPEIKKDTGLDVRLLVVGTGQALRLGRSGDVDAILVHSKAAEAEFVSEGFGTHRREIMFNDFVLIGPSDDPAGVSEATSADNALEKVLSAKAIFVSRGDDSGTHKKEVSLWRSAGLDSENFSAAWYREVGSGMGAALNTASGMNAYIIADRASWLNFNNKGSLQLLFEGDPSLFNQYAYLPVNPEKHPHVKHNSAMELEAWFVSAKAQKLIGSYKINGQTLFTPNAK